MIFSSVFVLGNYTCEVEWSSELPPVSIAHYLEVCVPPSVSPVNADGSIVDARQGDNVTLQCRAEGIPRPTIHWTSSRWSSEHREYGSQLNLTAVRRQDAGQYSCTAINGIGHPASDQITLRVQFAPIVTAVEERVKALQGDKVHLVCNVLSVPKPDVRWFFHRRQLKMDQRHMMEESGGNNFTLTVRNVREHDLGEYTCSAVNKISEGQAVITLSGIPFDLDITSSSNGRYKHTYNLTWTVKSFADLDQTEVSYRKTGLVSQWQVQAVSNRPQLWNDIDESLNSNVVSDDSFYYKKTDLSRGGASVVDGTYTFRHLSSNTEYEVKVRAKNKFGWSDEEPSFVFRTSRTDPAPQKMATFPEDNSGEWRSRASTSESFFLAFICYVVTLIIL